MLYATIKKLFIREEDRLADFMLLNLWFSNPRKGAEYLQAAIWLAKRREYIYELKR